jgi:hypothetical protein
LTEPTLFDPPAQRHSATSLAAARDILKHANASRAKVFEFIKSRGADAERQAGDGVGGGDGGGGVLIK